MENNAFWVRHRAGYGPREGAPWRALSAARAEVLAMLRGQPEPVTLAALVRAAHLHENTVREHLHGLIRRGLVRRHRSTPAGRGRPAWRYECTDADPEVADYPGMAVAVTAACARGGDSTLASITQGEAWGRQLARDRGAESLAPDAARDRVVQLLDDLGFEPEVADPPSQVRLTRCPLLQSAHVHSEVVCDLHLGIVQGALNEHGAPAQGTELLPFAEPGACVLVVPPLGAAEPTAP